MKQFLYFLIFLLTISTSWAQDSSLKISLEIEDEDGILHEKNTIQAFLAIENTASHEIKVVTEWVILTKRMKG